MQLIKFSLILAFLTLSFQAHAAWGNRPIKEEKKRAITKLSKRKKGFDLHQKRLRELEEKRLSVAYKQKAIRKKHAEQKDKARRNFKRTTEEFPEKDYRQFLAERKAKRKALELARKEYVKMNDELEKIYNNKEYKIDAKREYNLKMDWQK